ncbi:FAD-binding protein [Paenibacillus sp. CN-4]|uniref:FAD-binding protein n=1 Tax=Paenibacillus nanchangensis TaxID=3348343 RepID=UPI00397942F8
MIRIDQEQCTYCLHCVNRCPAAAIKDEEAGLQIDDTACTYCAICVSCCPNNAIVITDRIQEPKQPLPESEGICLVVEHAEGELSPYFPELVSVAKQLQTMGGQHIYALVIGEGAEDLACQMLQWGLDEVWVVDKPEVHLYAEDTHYDLISAVLLDKRPDIVLCMATAWGKSIFPRVAVRLRTGLCADCTDLKVGPDHKDFIVTRATQMGAQFAEIKIPVRRPQMATVKTNYYPKAVIAQMVQGKIVDLSSRYSYNPSILKFLGVIEEAVNKESIESTDIIVAAGRGIQNADNLRLIYALADTLGGKVAVTRPLVESGWIDSMHQVGLTGKMVKPKLYIACGVSGAVQHKVGMQHSEMIIAINTDRNAPIFDYSNYGIVGDLFTVIPEIMSALNTLQEVGR